MNNRMSLSKQTLSISQKPWSLHRRMYNTERLNRRISLSWTVKAFCKRLGSSEKGKNSKAEEKEVWE